MMSWGNSTTDDRWIFDRFKEGFFTSREQVNYIPFNLNQNLIAYLPPFGKNGVTRRRYREGSDLKILPDKMVLRYTYHPDSRRVDEPIEDFDFDSLVEASRKLYSRVDTGIMNRLFGGN